MGLNKELRKIFSIVFVSGYFLITVVLLYGVYIVAMNDIQLKNYLVSIVTMIFTAMSAKVGTITDFLFGGSIKRDDDIRRNP